MATAYVLINCELGSEEAIIEQLKGLEGVKEVHGTFGAYDILAKIESAMESYFQHYGEYPNNAGFKSGDLSLNELKMLRDPNGKLYVDWEADEDMSDAKDPWGQNYVLDIF